MGTCCDASTRIEFSFDPCNIYRDGPRGVGYPADARSVGDSHPSCLTFYSHLNFILALKITSLVPMQFALQKKY